MAVVSRLSFVAAAAVLAVGVRAESHLFKFQNNCGFGTPKLIVGGDVLSNGEDYTYKGIFSGIAYLQTGECGFNGDKCSLMEMTLVNGGVSSADISLIDPHKFNVPMEWSYINAGECNGQGKACLTADCTKSAFFKFDDYFAQVQCMVANSGLLMTFCPNGLGAVGGGSAPSSSSSKTATTTTAAHTTTTEAQHTTTTATPTTTGVAHTTTSKSVVTTSSSTATSTADNSSTEVASTIVASTSVAPSSAASTTLSVSSATSSSSVNRKQCKPGQKPRRKSDAAKREVEAKRNAEAIKREALAHHRRAHGHH